MDKILIAEPIYSGMRPDVYLNRIAFWRNVWANDVAQGFYDARPIVMGPRRAIRDARDVAIRTALEHQATHLFFMDDDILVPSHILDVLHRADLPIVGGLMHKDDGTPIVFKEERDGEVSWLDHPKNGIFDCAAVGSGCMLIQTEVLQAIQSDNVHPEYDWIFNYDSTRRTMDVIFCRRARQLGFTVGCWPDIPCVQVQHYPIGR